MDVVIAEVIKKLIQIDKDAATAGDMFDKQFKIKKDETQKQVETLRKSIIDKQAENINNLKEQKLNEASSEAEKIMNEANDKCSNMVKQFETRKSQIVNEIFGSIILNNSK